ncbi:GIY-YIG nuclease superfamily protein [Aedoeadaptatus ivorii]|uniref:GIY-YIG nuclease superfamily protein n=1 Tax=Aedoeadaptatus ivorii TaxID=54006 RepID=A0A3S5F7V8_9FIRM|nr:GIY-YIG nuclease family protein [Peptoniphilus ivorii]MDQ0507853.1 putative endonuclease [Peptoniphilus ivorii]VEJ35680.1 GIY-YIG nuclease superfamily protein [Peptoniphilus ivorii]
MDIISHYVYILRCADGSLYTGYTTDPPRRLKEHNAGIAAKYTRGRLPVNMVYIEEQESRSDALKREYALKQLTRQKKLDLIRRKEDANEK